MENPIDVKNNASTNHMSYYTEILRANPIISAENLQLRIRTE